MSAGCDALLAMRNPTGRRTPAQVLGDRAEDLAAGRLCADGWEVLGRRLRVGRVELDLVALDPGPPPALVVVEVRWRARRDFGLPEETLDWHKRAHLRAAVGGLLAAGRLPDGRLLPGAPARIDLVAIEPPRRAGGAPRLRHHRGVA